MRTRRYGPYRFLSEGELRQIHAAALRVLEETGVRVPDLRLLGLAEAAGARVDRAADVIRFPPALVERYLEDNRRTFQARRADAEWPDDARRTVRYTFSGQAVRAVDLDTGAVRPATVQDMAEASRIASALPEVTANAGLFKSSRVPPLTDDLYFYHTMLSHTAKPVVPDIMHLSSIAWIEEIAAAVHGGTDELRRKHVLRFNAFVSSPLQYPADALEKMWAVHDRGYPVSLGWPMTVIGASGLVTLAGAAVSGCADALSGIILTRMVDPHALGQLGSAPVTMDMRTGCGLYADPRRLVLCGAFMDLSRFYGFPCGGFHIGIDAGFPGVQAAIERTFTTMVSLAYWDLDVQLRLGILGPANAAGSLAQVFIDLEIGRMVEKLLQGIKVTDETLGLHLILEAGIGGSFLDHEHTGRFFREESWLPDLFERRIPAGPAPERDPIYEKARTKAKETLAKSDPQPFSPDLQKTLDHILSRAVAAVGRSS